MDSDERAESKGESKGDFEDAKAASSESKSSDEDIVGKVSKYFYENEDFAAKFESFVNEHANEVDLGSEEMRLEYTRIYEEYQALFESELEEYIKAQGSSVLAFYDAIRTASERDPLSSEAIFGQIMAATADFDIFMQMMREAAEQLKANRRK